MPSHIGIWRAIAEELTLLNVKDIHIFHELGLTVQSALPQSPKAKDVVLCANKGGESPFAGNVGEFGPRSGLNIKDFKGIHSILGLPSTFSKEKQIL